MIVFVKLKWVCVDHNHNLWLMRTLIRLENNINKGKETTIYFGLTLCRSIERIDYHHSKYYTTCDIISIRFDARARTTLTLSSNNASRKLDFLFCFSFDLFTWIIWLVFFFFTELRIHCTTCMSNRSHKGLIAACTTCSKKQLMGTLYGI